MHIYTDISMYKKELESIRKSRVSETGNVIDCRGCGAMRDLLLYCQQL